MNQENTVPQNWEGDSEKRMRLMLEKDELHHKIYNAVNSNRFMLEEVFGIKPDWVRISEDLSGYSPAGDPFIKMPCTICGLNVIVEPYLPSGTVEVGCSLMENITQSNEDQDLTEI